MSTNSRAETHNVENNKTNIITNAPVSSQSKTTPVDDDDDFVDISDEDTDMREGDVEEIAITRPRDDLDLHRLSANSEHDEDDSDEEHESMANHPLLSMLTGRLGQRRREAPHKWDSLHPVTSVLSVGDVEKCTALENEVFPEEERCSREKFEYRLARCPELSLGLFSRPTEKEAPGAEGIAKRRLIAHVVATRSPSPSVTDATMALPSNWKERKSSLPGPEHVEPKGHQEQGGTICIHSLAVAKDCQGMGLGSVLMKSYIQRIRGSKIADRIALLAHDHLISFYTGLGFQDMGPSSATFGGGNWHNLIMEFTGDEED